MGQPDIEYLDKLDRVSVLLHPLRLQIMNLAVDGTSATEAARQLGLPRQMVHYHVIALERAGLLTPQIEVRRRNMVERRLQTSARSYLIAPDILGNLDPGRRRAPEPVTAAALLALTARIQRDVSPTLTASSPGSSPSVLSFSSKLQFFSDEQRSSFVSALSDAVAKTIRAFTGSSSERRPENLTPFSLVLGLYPLPHPHRSHGSHGDATPDPGS
ncbi:MAG: helix-turn-helix domain-containing protein [Gemmatimonadota bacterium]